MRKEFLSFLMALKQQENNWYCSQLFLLCPFTNTQQSFHQNPLFCTCKSWKSFTNTQVHVPELVLFYSFHFLNYFRINIYKLPILTDLRIFAVFKLLEKHLLTSYQQKVSFILVFTSNVGNNFLKLLFIGIRVIKDS